MFGNRAIYHEGWVAAHAPLDPVADGAGCRRSTRTVWELYHVDEDFSQANDLAAQNPAEAQGAAGRSSLEEAIRNHVFPIDDRRVERFDPAIAGPPRPAGRTRSR